MRIITLGLAVLCLLAGMWVVPRAEAEQFLSPEPNRDTADRGDKIHVSLVYENNRRGSLPLSAALNYDASKVEFLRFKTSEALNVDHDASTGKLLITSALGSRISGGGVPKKIMAVDFRVRDDAAYGTAVFRTNVHSSSGDVIGGRYIDAQPSVVPLERFLPKGR